MPRPSQFDQEKAVHEAILLFWAKGYSNTSVRDLLSVMSIKESSFYNVWPSKSHLYLQCLDRYIEHFMVPWITAMMANEDPRQGLETFFDMMFSTQSNTELPAGCLMSRSLSSEVMDVPILREFIEAKWQGFGGLLVEFFQRAKDSGRYPASFDPVSTATLLGIHIQGIQRVVMVTPDLAGLRKDVSKFLDALGL